MTWFFIALIGPILYSIANHVDKYLISKYLKAGKTGSLILFSTLFNLVALPVILVIRPDVLAIRSSDAFLLAVNSSLIVVSVLCYFYALHKEEASYVVPFYQTIPVFGFALAYLILGESITQTQALGSLVILGGALVLSFEFEERVRFKHEVVLLMLTASLLYALNGVVFKLITAGNDYWVALFWTQIGQVGTGIILFTFVSSYRNQFLTMLRENRLPALSLNAISEACFIIAEAATAYALLLAPVALVLLVNSFQPLFVFVIGVIISVFYSHISEESLARHHLIQKSIGVFFVVLGAYVINVIAS